MRASRSHSHSVHAKLSLLASNNKRPNLKADPRNKAPPTTSSSSSSNQNKLLYGSGSRGLGYSPSNNSSLEDLLLKNEGEKLTAPSFHSLFLDRHSFHSRLFFEYLKTMDAQDSIVFWWECEDWREIYVR
eukprot:Awhi_evm1s9239